MADVFRPRENFSVGITSRAFHRQEWCPALSPTWPRRQGPSDSQRQRKPRFPKKCRARNKILSKSLPSVDSAFRNLQYAPQPSEIRILQLTGSEQTSKQWFSRVFVHHLATLTHKPDTTMLTVVTWGRGNTFSRSYLGIFDASVPSLIISDVSRNFLPGYLYWFYKGSVGWRKMK